MTGTKQRKKKGRKGGGEGKNGNREEGKNGEKKIDVVCVCTHEFGGNHLADVSLNSQLRDHDPNLLLENEARKKVDRYRDGYANRNGTTYTFHVQ